MARYEVHQKDGNEDRLRALMEAHGVTVVKIGRPIDLLVAFKGATGVVEVKTPAGKLEASQKSFLQAWPGLSAVLRTESETLAFISALKTHAARVQEGCR